MLKKTFLFSFGNHAGGLLGNGSNRLAKNKNNKKKGEISYWL